MDPYRGPGAMPSVDVRCLFCGARCGGDRCARCGEPTPGDGQRASELRIECPRCHVPLERTQFSDHDAGFVYCVGCHGCFVPPRDWAALLERVDALGPVAGDELAPRPARSSTALDARTSCPVCRETMSRTLFASEKDLPIDACILHGIWFDASELAGALRAAERDHDYGIVRPGPTRAPAEPASPTVREARAPSAPVKPLFAPAPEKRDALASVLRRLWEVLE